jgi:hypothetical protein
MRARAICHPDREAKSFGLCGSCYNKKRFAEDPSKKAKAHAVVKAWRKKNFQDYFLKREWGLSREDFEKLLAKQGGGCAICKKTLADSRGRRLYVDHDHVSGKIRGLLCSRCNVCLGQFEDSIPLLEAAISYLDEHKNPS